MKQMNVGGETVAPRLLLVLMCTAFALTACGKSPDSAQRAGAASQHEAGSEYRALFSALSRTMVEELDRSSQVVTDVESAKAVVDRLVWATTLPNPVWEDDVAAGGAQLPRLREFRILARLLSAYAQHSLRRGDAEAAGASIAALVRMAGHVGGKSVDEAVLACAICRVATDLINHRAHEFNRDQRRVLLAELKAVDLQDPFGGNANLRWERGRRGVSEEMESLEALSRWAQESVLEGLREAIGRLER